MEIEVRSFAVRSVDTEARTIEGIAAPFDEVFESGDFNERYAPGVFDDFDAEDGRPLYAEHNHLNGHMPIGVVFEGRNTGAGFAIKARISETPDGDTAWTLVKDGVLRQFSAGFQTKDSTWDDETATVTHNSARLLETSLTGVPAYKTAGVTAFRSMNKDLAVRTADSTSNKERGHIETMSEENTFASAADVAEIRDAFDALDRKVASYDTKKDDAVSQYRSAGEFVKAMADADPSAVAEYRAYTGATLSKSHQSNGWLDDTLKIINRGRKVVNLFGTGTLPASGNVVTYPYVSSISGAVASQALEGDDLTQLDITVSTATAPVRTFGVKSDLSLQVIQRSDVAYLDAVLNQQAASYAKVTNDYVRSVMTAASAQTGSSFTLSSATAANFLNAAQDGVNKIDANGNGLQAEFVLVSGDVWLQAVQTASTGFAFDVNGSDGRTIGNANVPAIAGSLAGLPVVVDGGLAAKSFYIASSGAMTTWENSAAPVRLDAENPVNLTHVYSIYGFLAAAVTNANGLVKATVA